MRAALQIQKKIIDFILQENLPDGARLPERKLAEMFGVSRTPVKEALAELAKDRVVSSRPSGGFAVSRAHLPPDDVTGLPATTAEDDICLAMAEDRLTGSLPDRVSENELMRRYGLSKGRLRLILARIVSEGWLEKLPGHGWSFARTLTSNDSLEQITRFRLAIEPTAILEPGFVLDRPALEAALNRQQALVDGTLVPTSPAQMFEIQQEFHATITRCSGNLFFIEAMKSTNNIRRLIVYRKIRRSTLNTEPCKQHIKLIELLLSNRRDEAAEFLRWHIQRAHEVSSL